VRAERSEFSLPGSNSFMRIRVSQNTVSDVCVMRRKNPRISSDTVNNEPWHKFLVKPMLPDRATLPFGYSVPYFTWLPKKRVVVIISSHTVGELSVTVIGPRSNKILR